MSQIDLGKFRLGGKHYNTLPIKTKINRHFQSGVKFIAPMPLLWIAKAAELPGHALHVALAIMYVHGMERSNEIILTRYHFNIFSSSCGATQRALKALQQAGLIKYTKAGHKHRVTIIPVESSALPNNSQ